MSEQRLRTVGEADPVMDDDEALPVVGPVRDVALEAAPSFVSLPRLARHLVELDDGHQVGVAVCGEGVPLVAVHGFLAEGILYAQTLSRIVDLGFKVVAIDVAGHGGTLGLPTGAGSLTSYAELLGRCLDQLGIERAVLMGHSMGGRLVTELAAMQPHRAIAVISLDGVVGASWDRLINVARFFPPVLAGVAGILVLDTLSTVPLFEDRRQAVKLLRLVAPTIAGHVRRPWRIAAPAVSIVRSRGSGWMLDKLAQEKIPFYAVSGDRDMVVPVKTAYDAARRAHGDVVLVHGGSHSWLLKDPESLPAIMHRLMQGRLGTAVLRAIMAGGVDPNGASRSQIESVFVRPDAHVKTLTPDGEWIDLPELHHRPRYRFSAGVE